MSTKSLSVIVEADEAGVIVPNSTATIVAIISNFIEYSPCSRIHFDVQGSSALMLTVCTITQRPQLSDGQQQGKLILRGVDDGVDTPYG